MGEVRRGEVGGGGGRRGCAGVALLLGGGLVRGCHVRVEGLVRVHHPRVLVLLVGVDGLGVLAEVVETRELLAAMAIERTLAGVFPDRRKK
jgi:hypothetical protein